jgi:type IV secretory pathway protease TraF
VVVCLPAAVTAFGRARGDLGPRDCPGGEQPVLKRIGAIGDDVLELGGETVDGQRGAPADPADREPGLAARSLPHVAFGSYVVAAGELWLFGSPAARSWDSRYFGPVSAAPSDTRAQFSTKALRL